MAASICAAFAGLRRAGELEGLVGSPFEQLCRGLGHLWRQRVFTLRVFLVQILHQNTAINHLRQLCGIDFSESSYCAARGRLPLMALQCLLQKLVDAADPWVRSLPGSAARIYLVDGSSFSMPDTPALRERFGMPAGRKTGVGYPMCTIMGMLDLASGLFTKMLALPMFTHDQRGVIGLHESLQKGDILAGDREGLALRSRVLFVLSLRLANRARRVRLLPTAPTPADRPARTGAPADAQARDRARRGRATGQLHRRDAPPRRARPGAGGGGKTDPQPSPNRPLATARHPKKKETIRPAHPPAK